MISELSDTQKKEIIHKKSNLPLNQTSVTIKTKMDTKMETDASDEDVEIPASHTDRTLTTFQTEIPLSHYKALVYLYREEFSHLFDVVLENGENMIVRARDDTAFKEIKDKMNAIRVDRMKLPSDLVSDFEDTLKANAKTVHVFCLPNPDQGEVDIFSLDYGNMVKARHLLNVTVGHIKVTSRSKRKIDHTQGEGNKNDGHLSSKTSSIVSKTLTPKDFKTESGIRVSVYNADITQLTVDAIVSEANQELAHGGGVACAIARAAGIGLTHEGDKYIEVHGTLKVTDVVPTSARNLPCKKVLHAVGPYWGDYQDKALCQQHLAQTVFNALETAHKLKFATLAMCSISSGISGVPKDICATMYLAAIQRFDYEYDSITALRHIHFVDTSDDMVAIIQDTFMEKWNTTVKPPKGQRSRTDTYGSEWNWDKRATCSPLEMKEKVSRLHSFPRRVRRDETRDSWYDVEPLNKNYFPQQSDTRQFDGASPIEKGTTQYGFNSPGRHTSTKMLPGGLSNKSSANDKPLREIDYMYGPIRSRSGQTRELDDRNGSTSSYVSRTVGNQTERYNSPNAQSTNHVPGIRELYNSSNVQFSSYIRDGNRRYNSVTNYAYDRNGRYNSATNYVHDRNKRYNSTSSDVK